MKSFFKMFGTAALSAAIVVGAIASIEGVAQARGESWVGSLVLKTAHGTAPVCALATFGDTGSMCAGGDIEALDDFRVGDDSTFVDAVTVGGALVGSGTAAWGSIVAGANTACNTTCTAPCLFGVNTAATEADIVACTDATADECLCFGAN